MWPHSDEQSVTIRGVAEALIPTRVGRELDRSLHCGVLDQFEDLLLRHDAAHRGGGRAEGDEQAPPARVIQLCRSERHPRRPGWRVGALSSLMTRMSDDAATYRRIRRAIEQAAHESRTMTRLQCSTELSSTGALAYAREHIAAARIEGVSVTVGGAVLVVGPADARAGA